MKALLLAVCVLTTATMVYTTADVQKVQEFYSSIVNCADLLHLPKDPSPYVIECLLHQVGLIDENTGELLKYKSLRYLEDIISDEYNLRRAQDRVATCMDHAKEAGGTNHENNMKIIECSLPVVAFIDRLS
ncbi:unnamed protein product [Lasius platythorax]|uniref:Ant venom allergen Sol i 2/4 domain-containing protein n=1 Tax=Lasius platythorax TaxID=488582 RepID=A0AAV2N4Q1_9HYME